MQRVGIIDDDDRVQFSVQVLLEVSGFEVETFASAEDFLACQDCSRFGCLVVDFRLSGFNGLELLRILKRKQVLTPAVVSSGFITESEEADFIAAGASAILHKPVEPKQLVGTIKGIIARDKNLQGPPYSEAG